MIFVRRLVWDPPNEAHIARHHVTPEEVEEVCHGVPIELMSYKQRILLIDPPKSWQDACGRPRP